MMQAAKLGRVDTVIKGVTNDYEATANSDVVIVTSGIPRKPGMTREELIGVNAGIVKSVVENIIKFSPNAIIVMISNPMDTMTYLTSKVSGLPKNRIIGMGGMLDSSRFNFYLSQALGAHINDVDGMVIGGHGDTTMVPLIGKAAFRGGKVTEILDKETADKVVADTMVGGATLTKLIGTSAWYAPGMAGANIAKAIIMDEKKVFPCCVSLEGEYGQNDICIGVPVVLGKNGVEKIVDIKLDSEEQAKFDASAAAVRKTNAVLAELGLI
jgi:malate dehydrogenase